MNHANHSQWQVRDSRGLRKYVTDAERERFLAAADRFAPHIRALCYVLAFTGARISEVLALTPDHIEPDTGALVFRTLKRRRLAFRTVPVPDHVIDLLLALPIGDDGKFWSIHRSTGWRWLKDVMALASISGPVGCARGLRHGFGIRAAGRAVPQNVIARWMGHASLTTTDIYLEAVGQEERGLASRIW